MLGRTFYYAPYLSPIHPGRVISTFVGLDIVVGILTANGASLVSNPSNSPAKIKVGKDLLRASILLQVGCFLCFVALEVVFHRRCIRANILGLKLRAIVYLLYISSAIILIRNVYRVVEVFQGYSGYVANHEAFFYVFDGALMLINSIMLNVYHPMMFLPLSNKVYLSKDGVSELEGPGWVDKRPVWMTFLDPFDLVGLIKGHDNKNKFWELEEMHHQTPSSSGPRS